MLNFGSKKPRMELLSDWGVKNGELRENYSEQEFKSFVKWFKRNFKMFPIRRLRKNVYEFDSTGIATEYSLFKTKRENTYKNKRLAALALVAARTAINEFIAKKKQEAAANPGQKITVPTVEAIVNRGLSQKEFLEAVNDCRADFGLPALTPQDSIYGPKKTQNPSP